METTTPSPSEPVRAWLEKLPSQHEPVVTALRRLVRAAAPDAHEFVYHSSLVYGSANSTFDPIFYISAFRAHVNLGFYYGVGFPDPAGLLIGSSKRMRHIKLQSLEECAHPALPALIDHAWALGLGIVAERRGRRGAPK
jgi:hypothetical protein